MNIGLTSITFRNESIDTVLFNAKKAGIDGIEWGICDTHMQIGSIDRAEEIKKKSQSMGIEIFSLGSYCYMDDKKDCDMVLKTAVMLGAPVIRVWAGNKASSLCDEKYYNEIVENTRYMADKAKNNNIIIGFEYHGGTLTDSSESAMKFITDVDRENALLYWQPDSAKSLEVNSKNFDIIKSRLAGNLHIHNYTKEGGYMPLSDIEANLMAYYSDIKDKDYNLIIEFVKDSSVDSLISDANTLKNIVK